MVEVLSKSDVMEERQLSITKTANYGLSGNKKATRLLVSFHGYGQLVKYFIRKFRSLEEDYLIVTPEALHYFYTQGFEGRVGASWMTSENRETEIQDYLSYVDTLLANLKMEFPQINEITLLGFSQGTATASRYFMHTSHAISKLIMWSGFPAHDLDYEELKKKLLAKPMLLIQGKTDLLRPEEIFKQTIDKYNESGLPYELTWYEGGHAVEGGTLRDLMV